MMIKNTKKKEKKISPHQESNLGARTQLLQTLPLSYSRATLPIKEKDNKLKCNDKPTSTGKTENDSQKTGTGFLSLLAE